MRAFVNERRVKFGNVLELVDILAASNQSSVVQELDVSECEMGDADATVLARALVAFNHLTDLNMNGNQIQDEGAAALADALASNQCLRELYLFGNKIGVVGAVTLADALSPNRCLAKFVISGNQIGSQGAAALVGAIAPNQCLGTLDISRNGIEDEGAVALADALATNRSLETLNVSGNRIGDKGVAAFAEMLRFNSVLKWLDLDGNNDITKEGCDVLGCVIRECNRTMEYLWLPAFLDCPCVRFFVHCNEMGLWRIIRDENALIPWENVLQGFLKDEEDRVEGCGLSMAFLLLQNRPEIVCGGGDMTR